MSAADNYTFRVHWLAEDDEYVGTVAELPSVSPRCDIDVITDWEASLPAGDQAVLAALDATDRPRLRSAIQPAPRQLRRPGTTRGVRETAL